MANKIYTNHTLEEYNKKYRNRKHRLLKLTKKEVEDFDKKNPTNTKGYLLKDSKWWLIGDTYYEIPKAPRYTWFRNLNGAVQVGCCLLGAGVIATAVTVPLVLMNQNKVEEPSITIQGADFDKSASHIELNKKSTIKLKEQSGKTIKGIEYVKVGDKKLADTQYSYDESTKVVTIKADAMTSTKVEIKVETEGPTPTKKYTISLDEFYKELLEKDEFTLTATVIEKNDIPELTWEVTGEKPAAIELTKINNTQYKVKAKETGTCEVKVSCEGAKSTSCTVKVKKEVNITDQASAVFTNAGLDMKATPSLIGTPDIPYEYQNKTGEEKAFDVTVSKNETELMKFDNQKFAITTGEETKVMTFTLSDNVWKGLSHGDTIKVTAVVHQEVTTKADFIKAYKDLRTKFNAETTKTYKPSQIKVKSWGGDGFANFKSLSDLTYDTTSNRSCVFKFKDDDGNEQFHEFGTNYLSDTELDSLLKAETESSVTYTIDDEYIEYIYDNPSAPGLQELKINKYGYIVSYSKYSGGKYDEFTLSTNGETDTYYNIDWATTQFELVSEQSKTLYEYAKTATQIIFENKTTKGDTCVGEIVGGSQEPVYASYTVDENMNKILTIWSAGKIRFTNNDKPEILIGFFKDCSSVTSFDFSNIDTSYVTDFSYCFHNCNNVENLDLSNFDTYSAINMASMFQEDYELKSVNVSSFNTSNVTDMNYMFYNCSTLTNLDLSSFVTSKVTEMYNMFCNCYSLESVDVSSFDTSSVEDMTSMFSSCLSLKTLDVSNFDTSSVEYMGDMFYLCLSLKTLDLTSFNTKKVTEMYEMFRQDEEGEEYENNLTTIYVGENFSTESVISGEDDENMFSGCTHLVGGNGTQWTEDKPVDKTYAKIDKEGQAGYFTDAKELPTSDDWFTFTPIEEESENVAYSISGTPTTAPCPSNFSIPSTHKGEDGVELPVTKIDYYGFEYAYESEIELLIIPSSIEEIGANSFKGVIDESTDIRFKDTTHTWAIKDIMGFPIKDNFNPSTADKNDVITYLTGEYIWSKNITAKEKFLEKATKFTKTFLAATSEYELSDITVKDKDGNTVEMNYITYIKDENDKRIGCEISNNDGLTLYIASNDYTKEVLKDDIADDGIYEIKNNEISYEKEFVLGLNKNGYATKLTFAGENYTIEYTGDPK